MLVGESRFELRTGVLGELTQKFVNYRIRLVVVGVSKKMPAAGTHMHRGRLDLTG